VVAGAVLAAAVAVMKCTQWPPCLPLPSRHHERCSDSRRRQTDEYTRPRAQLTGEREGPPNAQPVHPVWGEPERGRVPEQMSEGAQRTC
jgi:hypothetical protein